MLNRMLKSLRQKRTLDKQHAALKMIPRTRDMLHHKAPLASAQPGPEVYSVKAAAAKELIRSTGPMRQSTVNM